MSTIEGNPSVWNPISDKTVDPKYEKCRNITEEIYKRINITFQIKSLETGSQSDVSNPSEHIDSNDLSNDTDLFAYDKSDSISSSISELELRKVTGEKYISLNNNEETTIKKSLVPICKRPKKRFRKRVKKRQTKEVRNESEGSSDEAVPLSRIVLELDQKGNLDLDDSKSESPDNVMGVPKITIVTTSLGMEVKNQDRIKETKQKTRSADKYQPSTKVIEPKMLLHRYKIKHSEDFAKDGVIYLEKEKSNKSTSKVEEKRCSACNLSFRGERGLRRHMESMHVFNAEDKKSQHVQVRPA